MPENEQPAAVGGLDAYFGQNGKHLSVVVIPSGGVSGSGNKSRGGGVTRFAELSNEADATHQWRGDERLSSRECRMDFNIGEDVFMCM